MVLSWDLKFPYTSFFSTLKMVTSFFFFQSSSIILLIFYKISEWFSEYS